MATDVVTREDFTENYQIYWNQEQRWYYLGKQLAEEVIIFRQTDTDGRWTTGECSSMLLGTEGGSKEEKDADNSGCPHAGFRNPVADRDERPRESVEARAFVYY
jgi:hypothetical protein